MAKKAASEWKVAPGRHLTVNGRRLKPGTPVNFSEADTIALESRGRIVQRTAGEPAHEAAGEEPAEQTAEEPEKTAEAE